MKLALLFLLSLFLHGVAFLTLSFPTVRTMRSPGDRLEVVFLGEMAEMEEDVEAPAREVSLRSSWHLELPELSEAGIPALGRKRPFPQDGQPSISMEELERVLGPLDDILLRGRPVMRRKEVPPDKEVITREDLE